MTFALHPRRGQENGRGETARTGADDDDVFLHCVRLRAEGSPVKILFSPRRREERTSRGRLRRPGMRRPEQGKRRPGESRPEHDGGSADHARPGGAEEPAFVSILVAKRFDFSVFISLIWLGRAENAGLTGEKRSYRYG